MLHNVLVESKGKIGLTNMVRKGAAVGMTYHYFIELKVIELGYWVNRIRN